MNDGPHMTTDTKTQILDASESLFATRGIESTSLRAITALAGTNLAAVNYHFGSKDALIAAVVGRRVAPINEERLKLLSQLEAGTESPTLEGVLEAFFGPPMRLLDLGGPQASLLGKLISRIYWESGDETRLLILDQFREVIERFVSAIARTLPELPLREVALRFQFGLGVMIHTLSQ
ncbi:MAG: TetR/AcrR family transcriptional regulator, partial [Myxococcales bacterium]|nr:TetR/AcrR family transcriptional regulator [Myxococcales bacterium]